MRHIIFFFSCFLLVYAVVAITLNFKIKPRFEHQSGANSLNQGRPTPMNILNQKDRLNEKFSQMKVSSFDLNNCIQQKTYEANRDLLVLKPIYTFLTRIIHRNHKSIIKIHLIKRLFYRSRLFDSFIEQRLKQIKSNTFNNSKSVPIFEKEMALRNNSIKTKKNRQDVVIAETILKQVQAQFSIYSTPETQKL